MRQAVVDSSSHAGGNFTKTSANETGSNGDVENPTGQLLEAIESYKSHTILSQGSRRRTPRSTADDLHSFGKYGVPPLPMQSEIRGSDITRSSILSAQTQTPSLLRELTTPENLRKLELEIRKLEQHQKNYVELMQMYSEDRWAPIKVLAALIGSRYRKYQV